MSFRFLVEDFRLCASYESVNYGAWHVYNLCLVLLLLPAGSLVPKFHFQLREKKQERSLGDDRKVGIGRWRDSFSSAPCFVL